jgi:hypothetical protein
MISPVNASATADAGGVLPQSYGYKESFVEKESYSNENGKISYSYESRYEISSYRVSIGENDQNQPLVYNQSGTLNVISSNEDASLPAVDEALDNNSVDNVQATGLVSDNADLLDGAKNILSFIEQRMIQEQAAGATEEELGDIAMEGFEGFKQGFFEAKEILENSGQLNDDVQETLNIMYNQVLDGYFALKDQYVYGKEGEAVDSAEETIDATPMPTASSPSTSESASTSDASTSAPVVNNLSTLGNSSFSNNSSENVAAPRQLLSSNSQIESYNEKFKVLGNASRESLSSMIDSIGELNEAVNAEVDYGRLDRFSFELRTLDGDKVSINASNMSVFAGQLEGASEGGDAQVIAGMKETSEFSFDVEGELDEAEMTAIEDLLDQIMTLADEFYNGDIDEAFEIAMEMGYDQNEIASYSLKLRQTEQFSATAAYQSLAPVNEVADTPGTDALSRIGDYAQSVIDSLNKPENYALFDYTKLIEGISEQIDNQIKETGRPSFNEVMKDLIEQMPPVSNLGDEQELDGLS